MCQKQSGPVKPVATSKQKSSKPTAIKAKEWVKTYKNQLQPARTSYNRYELVKTGKNQLEFLLLDD